MSNGENMDNFTALYTSYLRFTFGTNSTHAFSCAYRVFGLVLAFLYKFMLFGSGSKTAAGTTDHVQITQASPGPVKVYPCRRNLTSNHIIYEKFDLATFQSD